MISLKQGACSPQLLAALKAHAETLGTNAVNRLRHAYGLAPLPSRDHRAGSDKLPGSVNEFWLTNAEMAEHTGAPIQGMGRSGTSQD